MYSHSVLKCSAGCSIGESDYPFFYAINNAGVYADRYGRVSNIRTNGCTQWITPEDKTTIRETAPLICSQCGGETEGETLDALCYYCCQQCGEIIAGTVRIEPCICPTCNSRDIELDGFERERRQIQ